MRALAMGDTPNEDQDESEPTSEFVDGLELIFGRGKSGYKDVYPHRKGWQAKVTVEDKGVCSLGVFKQEKQAALAVARAKSRGLHLLRSPDRTRAKPGCGGACQSRASHAKSLSTSSYCSLLPPLASNCSQAKAFFDASEPSDVFYYISRELGAPERIGCGAAARPGRIHASMHGRHAGSACGACGCSRVDPVNSAAAAQPPSRSGPPPRPLVPCS